MFCNALMITFFNPPSTHRLDNDPAGDSRHHCGSHLVQNQQHRSSSGPWSNVLMSQLTARSYLDLPNIWTLLLHGQRTCQRLATQRRLETGEAHIVCGSGPLCWFPCPGTHACSHPRYSLVFLGVIMHLV